MQEITYYDFDLDLGAEERWEKIFDDYIEQLAELNKELRSLLDQCNMFISLIKPFYYLTSANKIAHYDEICYISQRIMLSPLEVILLQLIYEVTSACTTAILEINGQKLFVRTMDYPLLFLKKVTIGLNIIKNGQVIGKVITWLGYIGFLTATSLVDNYTIAINYRRTYDFCTVIGIIKNLLRIIGMKWPIGYLVRRIISDGYKLSFAKKIFEKAELISPCYVTIFSPDNRSYIITRNCDDLVNVRTKELIQTNCDWDQPGPNILFSLERRALIREINNLICSTKCITIEDIMKQLLVHPIINETTIYIHYQYNTEYKTFITHSDS